MEKNVAFSNKQMNICMLSFESAGGTRRLDMQCNSQLLHFHANAACSEALWQYMHDMRPMRDQITCTSVFTLEASLNSEKINSAFKSHSPCNNSEHWGWM